MAEPLASTPRGWLRRAAATAVVALVIAVSWTQTLDHTALTRTNATFQRALAAFAVARALNGAISVAQGTELAVQPVGIGVTLTVGEALDPLNDLVESFSWLAMLASVSLGTQMLLAQAVGNPWINAVLSAVAAGYLLAIWWPGSGTRLRGTLMRALTVAVFARFLFALVTLATAWVDQTVLAAREQAALDRIELTEKHIEDLQKHPAQAQPGAPNDDAEASVLQRLGSFLDDQRQALDVRAQLDALTHRVENAIQEVINLLVVFTVQTILVPVAALLLAYWTFLALWRASWRGRQFP